MFVYLFIVVVVVLVVGGLVGGGSFGYFGETTGKLKQKNR